MARYSPRGGRGGRSSSRSGGSRGGRSSSRSGGRSSRGRSRDDYDDDYYDEEPSYYGKGSKTSTHEQAGILIFGGAVVVVIITIIFLAAGGGKGTYERAIGLEKGGKYEQIHNSEAASKALGQARYFDQANPYEDKEIVAGKYQDVIRRFPGTASAEEAQERLDKVMQRRK